MKNKLRVSDVAMKFGISKRTIKYYEEIGILKSCREEGSNYRVYDSDSLARLERILLLRKLNFSINDICQILISDNKRAQEIFQDKLDNIKYEIDALASLQSIVKSFLDLSREVGIDNVNIYQLLSEQIYIHKKVEGVINMSSYEGDLLKVEIGKSIIPYANAIIDSIKSLRSSLKETLGAEIPLIRLTDNLSICDSGYRILYKNDVKVDKKDIASLIKDLEDIITCNLRELTK